MHATPDRNSPSFFQFREGTRVEILAHKLAPRLPRSSLPPTRLLPPGRRSRKEDRKAMKRMSAAAFVPPPRPRPASRQLANAVETGEAEPSPATTKPPEAPPPPMEDWTLVRTKDGAAGWVLTRMLVMSIPDEVAQYSEGHRITSYFAMAEVPDGDRIKYDWLWTTQSQPDVPYDFDSFRYFVWNPRTTAMKRLHPAQCRRLLSGAGDARSAAEVQHDPAG